MKHKNRCNCELCTELNNANKSRESVVRFVKLASILAEKTKLPPLDIARHVCHLQRIARRAKANATALCNVAGHQERHDKRAESLRRQGARIVADLGGGFALTIGGDPRGPCCWLKIPGIPGDGWDRDAGHPIY